MSSTEAAGLLARYGPNAVAEERPHPWLTLLHKFWAPVPWMLEAAMDVLCVDKTGTITENRLTVAGLQPYGHWTKADLLSFGGIASDEATQDPIDLAILAAAHDQGVSVAFAEREQFIPFDPSSKRSEAQVRQDGQVWRVMAGAMSRSAL